MANKVILYDGFVTEVGNKYDDHVIKVRVTGAGDGIKDKGEYAYPLFPTKYFHVLPKIGDRVFVMLKEYTFDANTQKGFKRYWIGPMESQWDTVGDGYNVGQSLEADADAANSPKPNINNDKTKQGVYPAKDEVAVHKGNTDIILSNTQINIRAGKFVFGDKDKTKFNDKNQGIINIRYGNSNIKENQETETINETVYIDPEYSIYVEVKENTPNKLFGYIRVTKISDNTITYETTPTDNPLLLVSDIKRNLVVKRIKDYLKVKKRKYNRWVFTSTEPELANEDKYFDGHIQTESVKKPKKLKNITSSDTGGSVINVMANRINLFSYDGLKKYDNLLNNDKIIDEEEQTKINKELQSIVYGEKLVEFLRLVKTYVTTHIHPFHGMPPIQDNPVLKITEFDLDNLLNKNIKTN